MSKTLLCFIKTRKLVNLLLNCNYQLRSFILDKAEASADEKSQYMTE